MRAACCMEDDVCIVSWSQGPELIMAILVDIFVAFGVSVSVSGEEKENMNLLTPYTLATPISL